MRSADVPADLRRFILTSIPSVPFLEAILLLRAEPAASWDSARLAGRLYVAEKQAAELLQDLAEAGLAHRDEAGGSYRYQPSSPELVQLLDRLAQEYSANLVGVTDLIHSSIDKRAQRFADAFRWRKDN